MINNLDDIVLHRVYYPIACRAGRLWGATPGSLTRAAAIFVAVTGVMSDLQMALRKPTYFAPLFLLFCIVVVVLALLVTSKEADHFPNMNYIGLMFWRWIQLLLWFIGLTLEGLSLIGYGEIHGIEDLLDRLYELGVLSGLYFATLPPLPPKAVRIPAWSKTA